MSNLKVDRTAKQAFLQLPLTNDMAQRATVLNGNLQNKLRVEKKTRKRKQSETEKDRKRKSKRENRTESMQSTMRS